MSLPLWQLSASQASQRMARAELSSQAYVRACLERIEAREPEVLAWAEVDAAHAIAQAKACDAGPRRSPLHGLPVGVKDVIFTRDLPTRFNSPVYPDLRSGTDAHCVAVLRALGAVILGKTSTLEFACGGALPPTRNPWDLARTPGGSSSGSGAAVADGMVPLALGTQTGGSTIRPAAFCGTFALKPTWGRVPFDGIKGFSAHLDTVGFYGRSAEDLVLLAQAFRLVERPPQPLQRPLRLGVCRTPLWAQAEPEAAQAFEALIDRLARAGMALRPVNFAEGDADINRWQDEVMQDGGRYAFVPELLSAPERLHADFKAKLDNHLGLSAAQLRQALDRIALSRMHWETQLEGLDGVLTLSAPGVAPLGQHTQGMATFNRMWTALQVPCLNVPALWSDAGLPIGLQLVHRRYEEEQLLSCLLSLLPHLDTDRHPWSPHADH
jgi:Asp-tRNA(Asn)/Glu-tRNA(Gln) amidotransferase A subunit family amidase